MDDAEKYKKHFLVQEVIPRDYFFEVTNLGSNEYVIRFGPRDTKRTRERHVENIQLLAGTKMRLTLDIAPKEEADNE